MNITSEKAREHKNEPVAHEISCQLTGSSKALSFSDNRPEAVAQRRMQAAIKNGSKVQQFKVMSSMANSYIPKTPQGQEIVAHETLQRKSESIHGDTNCLRELNQEQSLQGKLDTQMKSNLQQELVQKPSMLNNIVAQLARNKKHVAPKLVRKTGFIPWAWNDKLDMTWGDWNVPTSSVHSGDMVNDQLKGGYTILFANGNYVQRTNFGPYSPGMSKEEHVERKFWTAMIGPLETAIAADETEDEDALVVIDINQHHTPCSGALGCTTFLDNQLKDLTNWDSVTAVGRFKAFDRYDSGLSETHPKHPKKGKVTDMEETDTIDLDTVMGSNSSMAVHSYTEQDRF